MELPQEIEAFYTIPAVRRELAQRLVKNGLTQRLVASKLGVTEAAVSQYLSNKRGTTIEYPADIRAALDKATKRITTGTDDESRREIISLCELFKDAKVICTIHKQRADVDDGCTSCYD